jgi:phage-related minor tail protein
MAVEKAGVEITAIDSATRVFNQIGASAKGLEKTFDSLKATGATLGIGFALEQLVEETLKWEAASFKLNATLKATGNAVGLTRKEMDELVHTIEGASPFDATDLREAEANLVKFGTIHDEVFKDALKLSADYAAFTGGSVAQASQTLGRALVDPVNGLKSLQKEFGNLTFSQKEYIAQLEAQGKTEEAQIAILDIVRSKIGGTAEAAANTGLTGLLSNLKKAWDQAGEAAALGISKMSTLGSGSGMLAGMFNADPNMMGPDQPKPPSWQEGFDQQNARIASSIAKVNEEIDRQSEAAAKAAPVVAQWTNLL